MAGELTHWLTSSAVERQHDRELEEIARKTDLAQARMMGLFEAGETAFLGTASMLLKRRAVSGFSPEDDAKLDLVVTHTVISVVEEIQGLKRRYR